MAKKKSGVLKVGEWVMVLEDRPWAACLDKGQCVRVEKTNDGDVSVLGGWLLARKPTEFNGKIRRATKKEIARAQSK